ncbi:hypothetical protein QQP08_008600 [Theobroma cacao]|uniref:Uncharacterized protein n=1 Tax=Theobroma cacao TaxID=3641 RepID=A0A061EHN9_THECC|nr:Uncharacterized protein TCM_011617 [Theobroma cacao]WRX16113.1 hypothetical protein QQP08_008600 [Theobroma cacao]
MPCQGDEKTKRIWTGQKSEGGKKSEATSDVVKAMEKSPTRRRMRMALTFRGTSAEVKRKSSRSMTTRSRNASSKIENWWTKVEDTTRFQLHSLGLGWEVKKKKKIKFNKGGIP